MGHLNPCPPEESAFINCKRGTLELTFQLLRQQRPTLALTVRNALLENFPDGASYADRGTELLTQKQVNNIITALSSLSEKIRWQHSTKKSDLVLIRSVLLDWLMIAREWKNEKETYSIQ